jgi:hypothetical protein
MLLVRVVSGLVAWLFIDEVFLVDIPNGYPIEGSSPSKSFFSSALEVCIGGETPLCALVYPVGLILMFLLKEQCCLLGLYSLANYSP